MTERLTTFVSVEDVLPLGLDLQDLQLADQYNDIPETADDLPTSAFINEDDGMGSQTVIAETQTATVESGTIFESASSSRQPFTAFFDPDASDPIPHTRVEDLNPNKFKLALGLWCEQVGISRPQYTSLREILRMLEPNPDISRLPETLSTLRRHTRGQLPLLPMRKQSIRLNPAQLPTETATRKAQASGDTREDLVFFDPQYLFKALLSSDFVMTTGYGGI